MNISLVCPCFIRIAKFAEVIPPTIVTRTEKGKMLLQLIRRMSIPSRIWYPILPWRELAQTVVVAFTNDLIILNDII